MKASDIIVWASLIVLLLSEGGCEQGLTETKAPADTRKGFDNSICADYGPVEIDIIPLTEFVGTGSPKETPRLKIYVSLLDSFGWQVRAPGIFRF